MADFRGNRFKVSSRNGLGCPVNVLNDLLVKKNGEADGLGPVNSRLLISSPSIVHVSLSVTYPVVELLELDGAMPNSSCIARNCEGNASSSAFTRLN